MRRRFATWFLLLASLAASLAAESVSYSYDSAGRLRRISYSSGKSIVYTYDASGNLLSRRLSTDTRRRAVLRGSLTPPKTKREAHRVVPN